MLLDDEEFIELMQEKCEDDINEMINLAAERANPPITWDEFCGDFT